MRIGILIGACGLAVAAAASADVATSTPVTTSLEGRSVDALHRAIGAPTSVMRDEIVRDLRSRVESGEISPFKVLLSDALPDWKIAGVGPDGPGRTLGGSINFDAGSRGVVSTFDDTFSTYPLSDDPIFGRFAISMQDQVNPSGETWNFAQSWYIPSLFVAGQMDVNKAGVADPLPRWQGADLLQDNNIGVLNADLNGDGAVDTADLGLLLGSFGATGVNSADLNGDMVVDTADLGLLLGEFGASGGPFCLYTVDVVQTTDTDGIPLDGVTIGEGPAVTETIAILNGAYSNDVNADGCPDCDFFRIETLLAVNNEMVYGTWTLTDAMAASAATADFTAVVNADTCSGWGNEAVLADARGETDIIENACCFFGARTTHPLYAPTLANQLRMEVDCFFTTLDTFQWVDTVSSVEGFTVTRTFMGGYAASLTPEFLKYSTDGSGFINHFIFLGNLPGNFQFGQFYGTVADPLVGNTSITIPTGRWFSLSYRLTPNDVSIWLLDETQYVANGWVDLITDPGDPNQDGSQTPGFGGDDIDTDGADRWFKIFPTGPAGPSPGTGDGQIPDIPQAPLAAVSSDTFRFLWSGDPDNDEVPGYEPHNIFYDNLHVEGVLFPTPDLPKFQLNYTDDIELYFAGANLALQGGRWFDALSSRAVIDTGTSVSGMQSIRQDNTQTDSAFRNEFETDLPLASSVTANWTASVEVALSATGTIRTIRLTDDTIDSGDAPFVARLLTAVSDENGAAVLEPGPVPPAGSTRIHLRVANPNFDSMLESEPRDIDFQPPAMAINAEYINVPTDIFWDDINVFHTFTFEVDAAQNMIVRRDGVIVNPDPVLAIAPNVNYTAAGWTALSVGIDEMGFESGNQSLGFNHRIWVDDVLLNGFGIEIADGPLYELPYTDGFEDYPANSPISGQGDTPFVDGASLVDTNLRIEQGLQALNTTATSVDDWCEYIILSDAIGGIAAVNDWGLADGDSIFVRQADCAGPVNCKDLQNFTNPNRLDEFFPNVGLFDDPDTGTKVAVGVRVSFVGLLGGIDPIANGNTTNADALFEWDTYDPANVFGKYVVNTIDDADPDTAGQQDIVTAMYAPNQPYNDGVGGKVGIGSVIAVDQVFGPDGMGVITSPGVIDVENQFRIVDPCEFDLLSGTWTYVGNGAGVDMAMPLDCTDVPHFNFVFDGFPRYTGGLGGGILVVDDPTASGRGNVLKVINNAGFNADGGSLFIHLRSTYPDAFAVVGTPSVFEVDTYVADNKSRYTIQIDGPNGTVTEIHLGGPDKDTENSPGEMEVPATNFSLLENNPNAGGIFGMGPDTWYYDTGVAVPLGAWFRLQVSVPDGGTGYTVACDASGMIGGDGVFEIALDTGSGDETNGASSEAGNPVTVGADAIDGFDTNTGLDEGGDGTFLRDPITVTENTSLPGAFNPGYGSPPNIVPGDFCYYVVDEVDGQDFMGNLPAPCGDVGMPENSILSINGVVGMIRNAALPNWPNNGNADICPTSQGFIWVDEAMTGNCTGRWTFVDADDPANNSDWPINASEVDSWGDFTTIPPFNSAGDPSTWYFDNVSLSGSDTE